MNDGALSRRRLLAEITPVMGLSLLAIAAGVGLAKHDEPQRVAVPEDIHDDFKAQPFEYEEVAAPSSHAKAAYLQDTELASNNTSNARAAVIARKRRQIRSLCAKYVGVPYVWGGSTPRGFDCSGYTKYVFHKVGLYLPRTAADQVYKTLRVSRPRMGDLVFFGHPAYHVGVYDAQGYMFAAPHTGARVKRQKIWSSTAYFGRHPRLA